MGMYDYINGEQIKCFYNPIFQKEYGLWHSGGSLISYNNGDKLPLKSLFYNYSSNLGILDITNLSDRKYILHIIKDGRVFKTVSDKDLVDSDLNGVNSFINYYGIKLNLKSKTDILNFMNDKEKFETYLKSIRKNANSILSNLNKSIKCSRKLKNKKANVFEFIKEEDIQKSSLIGYNLDKLNSEKANLIKDEQLLDELRKIVLERIEIEHKMAFKQYDEEDTKCTELINPLKEQFNERWILNDNYKEELFGELLTCFTGFLDCNGDVLEDKKDDFKSCIKKFFELIDEDDNIVSNYIHWQSKDDKKYKLELEQLLNDNFIKGLKSNLE